MPSSLDDHEIAEECWVDVDTVLSRLATLTAAERVGGTAPRRRRSRLG